MKKFLSILNRKLSVGNVLAIIASCLFAIVLRHSYLHFLDILPVRGGLEVSDISYLSLVAVFKFILTAYLEYLLGDKFSILLFEAMGQKQLTTLSMVNSDSKGKNAEASSKGKNVESSSKDADPRYPKEDATLEEHLAHAKARFEVGTKMWNGLDEQRDKINKLYRIKSDKGVKFFQVNGGLELDVPSSMTDTEANKLSQQVGALDRALQNKFSEYNNLSRKDVRLYESNSTDLFKERADLKRKDYEDLFEKTQ